MPEFLYHNKGNGTFEEVGLDTEVAVDGDGRTYAGMGVDFADYNNDGLPDLVVNDLANQRYALYQNNGDGSFTYASDMSGIGGMTLLHSGWGIRFLDYDNDGWKDLLIAQGHDLDTIELNFPQFRYREPMLLARNTGKASSMSLNIGRRFPGGVGGPRPGYWEIWTTTAASMLSSPPTTGRHMCFAMKLPDRQSLAYAEPGRP